MATTTGTFVQTATDRVHFGRPSADAVSAEAERAGAGHVFLMVSGTLNRETDVVALIRDALGDRCAGVFDRVPAHNPRDAVVEATDMARRADAPAP